MPPKRNKEEDPYDQWPSGFGALWEDDAHNGYPSRGGNGAASATASLSGSLGPVPISQGTRYNSPQPSARKVPVPTSVSNLRNQFPLPNPTTALPRFPQPGPQRNPAMQFQAGFGMPPPGPSVFRRPRPPPEPMSQTLEFVTKSLDQPLPEDVPRIANPHDMKIAESRGAALVDATRAFYGNHRPAPERFLWTLPPEHDERVTSLLDWIEQMAWPLANFGVQKFLSTRKRGAVVSNAGFISRSHPDEPVFDWLTLEQAQKTHDRNLQESMATYDPATTTLMFVFLVSPSYSSVAIWRRKLTIPLSLQLRMSIPLEQMKKDLGKSTSIIYIKSPALWSRPPRGSVASTSTSPREKTVAAQALASKPVVQVKKKVKKKKPKWWQFWKRITLGC